jgi:hypothetical protein
MFKTRNIVTVVLVLGVAAGVWMSDLWKGFGGGKGLGLGDGDKPRAVSTDGDGRAARESGVDGPASTTHAGQTVRVVIRDRDYFLKEGQKETPLPLDRLVNAVRDVSGDDDGIRLRVYRAESMRMTTEIELRAALQKAEIPESATYWSPDAAK